MYAVGGRVERNDTYQELARLVAAIEAIVVDCQPGLIFAGARLVANRAGHGLAAAIGPQDVRYTSRSSEAD